MCGIVGYVGKKRKIDFIVNTLKNLEYRGYDSSGIAILDNNQFICTKAVGNISELEKKVDINLETTCSISHTRWATHGKPNTINAHPHISRNKTWAIVHNGIIENYLSLKEKLNYPLISDTDTSVVVQLLEEKNVNDINNFIDCINELKGSYGIVAMSSQLKDTLFVAKKRSPIYVSINENGDSLIASDPTCFSNFSKEYYSLNDNEFAYIKKGKTVFYNNEKQIINKKASILNEEIEKTSKDKYEHYMLKEIEEQPKVLKRLANVYKEELNKYSKDFINKFTSIKLIGCGTAYNACLVGAKYFERILNIPSYAEIASEFIYNKPLINKETLYIFISQSGETADTIKALELVKEKNARTIALTNVTYSLLAKEADYILPVCAGKEIAVASTKAYTCQLAALYLFAMHFANSNNSINEVEELSNNILNIDFNKIEKIADEIKNKKDIIFIGKDFDSVTASEGALKLKVIAYINASNYPSGELKHGFLALVEEGTPLISIATNNSIKDKTLNAANEAVSRGAEEYIVTCDNTSSNNTINVKAPNDLLMPISSIVPLQLLAYMVSCKKGINPDQPRNLAKSVTVE